MRSVLAGLDSEVPSQVVDAPGVPLELDLPVIVKPADAQGQRGVRRVDDAKNLDEAVRTAVGHSRSGRAIIERYVAGPEVSVNGYLVDGRLAFCAVSDRLTWPQHTGLVRAHVLPADTVAPERHAEIREVLDAAAAALGITNGPVYAQMKVDDRPRVLEVTPRLDGCHLWRAIRAATGVDLLDTTLRHLVAGEVPSAALEQTRSSAATIEFMCAVPGQPVDYSPFATIEEDADKVWHYYEPGDVVRPVNGHYEKVGYTLSCSPVVAESRP
jgi:biotin carboxylase